MSDGFTVRITAREYEVDTNGHVSSAVLLRYGHHARWSCLRAAGFDHVALAGRGLGPVSLEERIRFHREVLAGDVMDVTCEFHWREGKTFTVEQRLRRDDGTLLAEITNVGGLLDLARRRLVERPGEHWRELAVTPELLGL